MEYQIKIDEKNRCQVSWKLNGISAEMIDWFWCNIEKCNYRHHSKMEFRWTDKWGIRTTGKPIGAIYEMEQEWIDGGTIRHLIRIESLDHVPPLLTELIRYSHVVVLGGISLYDTEDAEPDGPAYVWRMHQWEQAEGGVRGITTGYTRPGCDAESGELWAMEIVKKLQDWELYLAGTYEQQAIKQLLPAKGFSFCVDRELRYAAGEWRKNGVFHE